MRLHCQHTCANISGSVLQPGPPSRSTDLPSQWTERRWDTWLHTGCPVAVGAFWFPAAWHFPTGKASRKLRRNFSSCCFLGNKRSTRDLLKGTEPKLATFACQSLGGPAEVSVILLPRPSDPVWQALRVEGLLFDKDTGNAGSSLLTLAPPHHLPALPFLLVAGIFLHSLQGTFSKGKSSPRLDRRLAALHSAVCGEGLRSFP